ncbi:MAG: hypothetical protein IPP04_03215 [Saprospiraceae bacterium]|nr:hypothetical protein [Saprospiraceae bacterium]
MVFAIGYDIRFSKSDGPGSMAVCINDFNEQDYLYLNTQNGRFKMYKEATGHKHHCFLWARHRRY